MPHPPIPALRGDLEIQTKRDGSIELRDPFLLSIYTVPEADYSIAKCFDGLRGASEVRSELALDRRSATLTRIEQVAREFSELHLLDRPEVWDVEPTQENVAPWGQLGGRIGLEVLPVAQPEARWNCNSCGHCCHGLQVELTAEEEARIDPSLYRDVLGDEDFSELAFLNADEPAKRVLRQGIGDACIFLTDEGRCHIHARQGMAAKPNACQAFPLMILHVPEGPPRLGLRVNCQSMFLSFDDGPAIAASAPVAREVFAREHLHVAPPSLDLFDERVTFAAYEALAARYQKKLAKHGLGPKAFARIDEKLLGHRVAKSRKRFAKRLLAYAEYERSGEVIVGSGAYAEQLDRLPRGRLALERMRAGKKLPKPSRTIRDFLLTQTRHVLYMAGPLNGPDAGYGLVALTLALEATLQAIGDDGDLGRANDAFDVFTNPLFETQEHFWPILDAIDRKYARRVRKEMS